jgi:hypothetical protein
LGECSIRRTTVDAIAEPLEEAFSAVCKNVQMRLKRPITTVRKEYENHPGRR